MTIFPIVTDSEALLLVMVNWTIETPEVFGKTLVTGKEPEETIDTDGGVKAMLLPDGLPVTTAEPRRGGGGGGRSPGGHDRGVVNAGIIPGLEIVFHLVGRNGGRGHGDRRRRECERNGGPARA